MSSHQNFLAENLSICTAGYCRAKNEAYDVAARHAVVLVASAFTFDPSLGDFVSWRRGGRVVEGFVGLLFMLIMSLVLKILDHYQ